MTRRILIAFVSVALASTLLACERRNTDYSLNLVEAEVAGPGTLGLSVYGQAVKGLVVYFHGADQTARVIRDDEKHRNLFDPMLRAGYAIVAADAGGNAFGNPGSQQAYRKLVGAAQRKYASEPLFFVVESMGTLPALTLIREDINHSVKALVGISPMMGLPPDARAASYIADPWGGNVPAGADPMSWPKDVFANRVFRLYLPNDDQVIPEGATGRDFAARFDPPAIVELIECSGGHVASDCYRGSDTQEWMVHFATG